MRKMNNNYPSNIDIIVMIKYICEQLFYNNIINWGGLMKEKAKEILEILKRLSKKEVSELEHELKKRGLI